MRTYLFLVLAVFFSDFAFPVNIVPAKKPDKIDSSKPEGKAVLSGLEWFKRHQCPYGGWGPRDYADQCKGVRSKCKAGTGGLLNGSAQGTASAGLTGLGALCFLNAGYTHKSGKYKKVVQKALNSIIVAQKPGGYWGKEAGTSHPGPEYAHGICTLALAKAYGMTKDGRLKRPLMEAVGHLMKSQHPGMAWGYTMGNTTSDTPISGFILQALVEAKKSGITKCRIGKRTVDADYEKAFKGLKAFFTSVCTGKHKGIGGYRTPEQRKHSATGVVLTCRLLMGAKKDDPAVKEGVQYLVKEGPKYKTKDKIKDDEGIFYVYFASQGLSLCSSKGWEKWNKEVSTQLMRAQIKGGCADGSWPCANGKEIPGFRQVFEQMGGKVYSTALSILTLELSCAP